MELRGLNGLCPDVTKWSAPPGPAAFLDAGLPNTGGGASLPRSLSVTSGRRSFGQGFRKSPEHNKSARSNSEDSGCCDECNDVRRPHSRLQPGVRLKKSRNDSVVSTSSSIPAPTWEAEGPEGLVSQVSWCMLRATFTYQQDVQSLVQNQPLGRAGRLCVLCCSLTALFGNETGAFLRQQPRTPDLAWCEMGQ